MRQLTSCLVCAGENLTLLYPATFRATLEDAHEYFLANRKASAHEEIRRCADCGFIFTSKQFEESQYDQIYSRIARTNTEDSIDAGPGGPATQARLSRLKSMISTYVDLEQPFLDFGCGDGSFLQAVCSSTGTGFEVGAPCVRPGPCGSRIVMGAWPTVAGSTLLPWGSQNLVTSFDVFEHLCNLERDVTLIRRVLRPQGYLFVTLPDAQSPVARLSGRRWSMLLLEHLWYFSGKTLDRFMLRLGFAPITQRGVPYDASLGHIAKRLGETLHLKPPPLPRSIRDLVIPVPAGILLAGYRAMA